MLNQFKKLWFTPRYAGRKGTWRQRWFVATLTAIFILMLSWQSAAAYPPTGTDAFDSAAVVKLELTGQPEFSTTVVGPTRIERSDPFDPGDGRMQINTEIVAMELRGTGITVRESWSKHSSGQIRQKTAGIDFPAESFFDVFVEVETPGGIFHNTDPIRMEAEIDELPPFQEEYIPPSSFTGVDLFDASGNKVGVITHASHFVGQKPSFSVAPGGPSGFDPADIFDVPTTPRIQKAKLGLQAGDNLDGLSYGIDYIDKSEPYIMDIRFSVDPLAVGVTNTAVHAETNKVPKEAHGDEFRIVPMLPVGGSNAQVLDETGDTAPPFPLQISDDVDALTEPPASFVDPDGDGTPDLPVYFSLAPGSPTLGAVPGATPADILMSMGGAPPTIFIPGATLGLLPIDDVDAFCLEVQTQTVLFSLAPGSPSLGGNSPADLFLPGPVLFIPSLVLGLLPTDNLNALKCTLPEVDRFPNSTALVEIEVSPPLVPVPTTVPVPLQGLTTIHVGIGPEGAAKSTDADPLEQVQTEIVELELTGNSSLGPATVKLRDPSKDPFLPSAGEIEETANNTPNVLDVPPFAAAGTAESFFDVYFEVQVGDLDVLHTRDPKKMQAIISHKPPAEGEKYENADPISLYSEAGIEVPGIKIKRTVHIPNPLKLTLIKTVDDDTPIPGQLISYTLTISNDGTVNATQAVISDTMPDGITFVGPVTLDPPGAGTPGTAPPILASSLTITAGKRITLTFPVSVQAGLDPGTVITNTAAVTSTEVIVPRTGQKTVTVGKLVLYLPIILKN